MLLEGDLHWKHQPDFSMVETPGPRMSKKELKINMKRLSARLAELAKVGGTPDGGVCRLALTNDDKIGRDLVVGWMREGLRVEMRTLARF